MAFFGIELIAKRSYTKIENPQTIGEHIRKRRQELRLFQSDVAKILDVSEDTITYWENGRSSPQISYYPRIIQFLGNNPFSTLKDTLGGRIKNYRVENGISQKQLAKIIGVDEGTLRSWETEIHIPQANMIKLLEEIIYQKELSI